MSPEEGAPPPLLLLLCTQVHQVGFELCFNLIYNEGMKKIFLLLLISIGLSGCGRDYEDMLDELKVEICNFGSMDFLDVMELGAEGMEEMQVRMEELQREIENELGSLPKDERIEVARALLNFSRQAEQIQSGDLSDCN